MLTQTLRRRARRSPPPESTSGRDLLRERRGGFDTSPRARRAIESDEDALHALVSGKREAGRRADDYFAHFAPPYSCKRYWIVRTLMSRISAAFAFEPSVVSSVLKIA